MDASITPLRHGGLSLVQTTDFFYPLVEDPYMQGTFRDTKYPMNVLYHTSFTRSFQVRSPAPTC